VKRVICLGLCAMLVSACTTIDELKSTKQYSPDQKREGVVNVASRATGIDSNKVGSTTVLTVPIGSIKVEGDTSASIMKSVTKALEAAGYNSQGATFTSADAGYLRAHIEDIRFGNFLASSWGTIIIHLRLETLDGDILWKTRIRSSVNAINNYDRTAIVAMNKLVKDMSKTFAKEDFYQATQRVKRHNEFLNEDKPAETTAASAQ